MGITLDELKIISAQKGFNIVMIERDYLLTRLLYLIKDVEGIYFKGGTALNKIFLDQERLSEDLDFSLTRDISSVEKDIKSLIKGSEFIDITHDKRVDRFIRLVVHYKLFHDKGTIFIDLNERAKLEMNPEEHKVKHFYNEHIPEFSVKTLAKNELIAEKMAATMGRNKPRDFFDMYKIVNSSIKIDLSIVKKKCLNSGNDFSIIRMFKNASKLKNKWNEDLNHQLKEEISFETVMKTLSKYFKLKEEKEIKENLSSHRSSKRWSWLCKWYWWCHCTWVTHGSMERFIYLPCFYR